MRSFVAWLAVLLLVSGACDKQKDGKKVGKGGPASGTMDSDPKKTPPIRRKSRRPPRKCVDPPAEQPEPPDPKLPNVKERLPKWAQTVKVMRKLVVREKPSTQSDPPLGEIKRYSRLPLSVYVTGRDGCRRYWMRVMPRGWVCGDFLKPDRRDVLLRTQPIMKPGRFLPGRYAWVRKGGAKLYPNKAAAAADKPAQNIEGGFIVRHKKSLSIAGKPFWQISGNWLIRMDKLLRHHPSKYVGADLRKEDMMLPVAIVRAKTRGAPVFDRPGGKEIERVSHHTKHEILETKREGRTKHYRIGPNRWILARRVISAWPNTPPPGTKPCEKWIEIVIDHQSLVAYEGTEPVYATMVSTGDKRHNTKYGIFRLWWKKAETDMTSSMAGSERYRVDDVPWAQFFYLGQALHGAYWHSDWGNRRSHGCINLSPRDAKWLYDWTAPHVPAGWTSRRGYERFPGTLVRVRHKVDHEVPFLRYARKLAPPEEVKRLDKAYEERMRKKTIRKLQEGAR